MFYTKKISNLLLGFLLFKLNSYKTATKEKVNVIIVCMHKTSLHIKKLGQFSGRRGKLSEERRRKFSPRDVYTTALCFTFIIII